MTHVWDSVPCDDWLDRAMAENKRSLEIIKIKKKIRKLEENLRYSNVCPLCEYEKISSKYTERDNFCGIHGIPLAPRGSATSYPICPSCGSSAGIGLGKEFCTNCGSKIGNLREQYESRKRKEID